VCGALETGQAYYEQLSAGRKPNQTKLRAANQARLTEFAEMLRTRVSEPVIDPGVLRVDGWPNSMYGALFLRVIELYARETWFTDGWQYSHGATSEYLYCLRGGISCKDASGKPLPPTLAGQLIANAVQTVNDLGLDASKLASRLEALSPDTSTARAR
jgi:hypothetical protein